MIEYKPISYMFKHLHALAISGNMYMCDIIFYHGSHQAHPLRFLVAKVASVYHVPIIANQYKYIQVPYTTIYCHILPTIYNHWDHLIFPYGSIWHTNQFHQGSRNTLAAG